MTDKIEEQGHKRGCEGRNYACTCGYDDRVEAEFSRLRSSNEAMRKALEWQPIETAPRDGSYVWLWNKHVSNAWEAPQQLRWSTHYSVFGLGGCWTDGLCTMGDGIDFDFWCEALPARPSNPYETASAALSLQEEEAR